MTREEFVAIRLRVLQALGDSPRKPDELLNELLDEGLEDAEIRDAVWWMISEGMVRFSRGLRLEAIPRHTEDVPATN
ncbi:MAG: hypothetical protein OXC95_02100 [Dehalococcoidia bacterium]|nr:hypothetical protein [Dehalococcoidia bacterium]